MASATRTDVEVKRFAAAMLAFGSQWLYDLSSVGLERRGRSGGGQSMVLALDPWLLEYFEMQCRAKKVVDANPDLYPVTDLSPERRYTSRKLNMTRSERKRLADGVRSARREIRALRKPNVRL